MEENLFVAVYFEKEREGEIKQSRQKVNHNLYLPYFFS